MVEEKEKAGVGSPSGGSEEPGRVKQRLWPLQTHGHKNTSNTQTCAEISTPRLPAHRPHLARRRRPLQCPDVVHNTLHDEPRDFQLDSPWNIGREALSGGAGLVTHLTNHRPLVAAHLVARQLLSSPPPRIFASLTRLNTCHGLHDASPQPPQLTRCAPSVQSPAPLVTFSFRNLLTLPFTLSHATQSPVSSSSRHLVFPLSSVRRFPLALPPFPTALDRSFSHLASGLHQTDVFDSPHTRPSISLF